MQKNIAAFGGDPNRVTIMGQSAGGALVQHVAASPRVAGLFQRAIVQSGANRIVPLVTLAEAGRHARAAGCGRTAAPRRHAYSGDPVYVLEKIIPTPSPVSIFIGRPRV